VPIVFVVGCEDIYTKIGKTSQRQARNFMFISMTRSKGWVYLYATGRVKTEFNSEMNAIKKNLPNISFTYPSNEKINELAKIDFLTNNPKAKAMNDELLKFKKAVKKGDASVVKALLDLDPELKEVLQQLVIEDEN